MARITSIPLDDVAIFPSGENSKDAERFFSPSGDFSVRFFFLLLIYEIP